MGAHPVVETIGSRDTSWLGALPENQHELAHIGCGWDGDPSIPVGQRQLFLDDDAIAKIENLKRALHQPQKRVAVIRSVNPAQTIQTRTAPIWDPEAKHFKLWVMSTDEPLRISNDGLPWTAGPKPNMRVDHDLFTGTG